LGVVIPRYGAGEGQWVHYIKLSGAGLGWWGVGEMRGGWGMIEAGGNGLEVEDESATVYVYIYIYRRGEWVGVVTSTE